MFAIDLHVHLGECYALVGHNGSGKTTLVNLCLGYLTPDEGEVWIAGVPVATAPVAAKMHLAYVPEVARLYPHLTAREHLRFFDTLLGYKKRESEHDRVLTLLRMSAVANEPVRTYSKGMRQKVAIALGLLKGADVFLLDEPTSGLDPESSREFVSVVRELKAEGKAILMATHDLSAVTALGDRCGVLTAGRLSRELSPSALGELAWGTAVG